jgi:hypothetical protein
LQGLLHGGSGPGVVSPNRPAHFLFARRAAGRKGKRLMEVVVERLSSFLIELAVAPMDDTFPY